MCNHLSFISTTQQTLRPSKKCLSSQNGWEKTSYPGMSAEACRGKHEMQLASKKVYWKNNRVFQTLATYHHWKQQNVPNTCDILPLKTTESSKHLWHITIEDTRVFQTLATYCHCIMQFYFLVQNYVTPPLHPSPKQKKNSDPPISKD